MRTPFCCSCHETEHAKAPSHTADTAPVQAEYQQHAGEAISALAAANRAHVRPDGSVDLDEGEAVRDTIPTPGAQDSNGTSLPGAEAAITPATATGSAATALGSDTQAPGTLPVGAQAVETESPGDTSSASQAGQGNPAMRFASAAAAAAATAASAASAAAAAFEATGSPAAAAAAAAAAAGGPDARPAAEDGPPSLLPPPPLTAAELDEEALRRLLALARRAGYTPLTLRDVQLADSLNADYLSQLFIKGGTGRLDSAFVQVSSGRCIFACSLSRRRQGTRGSSQLWLRCLCAGMFAAL